MFVQSEPSSQNLVSVATDGEIASRMRVVLTGARINTYFFAGVQSGQFTSVGLPTLETSPPVHWPMDGGGCLQGWETNRSELSALNTCKEIGIDARSRQDNAHSRSNFPIGSNGNQIL